MDVSGEVTIHAGFNFQQLFGQTLWSLVIKTIYISPGVRQATEMLASCVDPC